VAAYWVGFAAPRTILAGDPAFVGLLALATEPDVAKKLGLSDEVIEKLETLIEQRESEALELALKLKDLPADERTAQMKPFVAESERLGFMHFEEPQLVKLHQIRVFRAGLATLGEPDIADRVGLLPEQRTEIAQLLQNRATDLTRGTSQERATARSRYERELSAKLNRDQRNAWERLAGIAAGPLPTASKSPAADATATTKPDTAVAATPADSSKPVDSAKPEDMPKPTDSAKPPMAATADGTKPADMPKTAETAKPAPAAIGADGERRLKFAFRFAPWKDVLEWFATQADLSLTLDAPPPGTFNYTDSRTYTPEEAIDLINGVLLTKGYVLIRRERLLLLLNVEDELPDQLIELVPISELDKRGRFELVRCLFPLKKLTPEDAEKEIGKLIGPQGKVMTLAQSKQLLVRESAGRLRAIRDLIAAVEDPEANRNDKLVVLQLENMTTDQLLIAARPLLGIPDNINAAPDGTLKISPDALNQRLLVTGKPERVEKLEEIVKLLDLPSAKPVEPTGPIEEPQLEVYAIGGADPSAVLQVMQTLMAGQMDVRLAIDPKTSNLVALAKPSQHATIRATLAQLQKDASDIEVFFLKRVDPQVVTVAINKLFGGDEKSAGAGAPRVESDPTARQLLVRGTPAQISQVRSLLQKMGEGENIAPGEEVEERGNVRTIPLTGRAAQNVLDQLETLWPTVRPNRIRIVRPASGGTGGGSSAFKERRLEQESASGTERTGAGSAPASGSGGKLSPESPLRDADLPPELRELRRLLGNDFLPSDLPLRDLLKLRKPASGDGDKSSDKSSDKQDEKPNDKPGAKNEAPQKNSTEKPAEKPAEKPVGKSTEKPVDGPADQPVRLPMPPRNALDSGRPNWIDSLVAWQNPAAQSAPAGQSATGGQPAPATGSTPPAPGTPAPNPTTTPDGTAAPAKPVESKPASKRYVPPIRALDPTKTAAGGEPAEVVITVQPGGLVIASQDTEALDAVENLLTTLGEQAAPNTKEFTVFYLKYAPAAVAAALVQEVLGAGGDTGGGGGGGGGGSLLGDLASGMLGDMGGGLLGGLLGGGGGGGGDTGGGPITITSDARLNALFVRASATDLEMVEELLRIIDREASPEDVQTNAPPRFIPVFNTSAEEVATVVRQVYATRLVAEAAGQQRQPSPEEFLRALRGGGGRGGQGGGKTEVKSEPAKITIGVDARSNSLIVSAPEPLFLEIKALVDHLDEGAKSSRDETTKVLTIKSTNPQTMVKTLTALTGGKAQSSTSSTTNRPGGSGGTNTAGPQSGFQPTQMQDELRRRIDSFNRQRGGGGGNGGGGGFQGFPGGSQGGGGFPGGGFPGMGGGGRGGRGGRGG
jgi:type II secretory pathway component GspD/PulD (secretin)